MPGFKSDQSTGLLQHFAGTIGQSFAGTNAQYQDGTVVRVTWDVEDIEVLQEDYDGLVPDSIGVNITLGNGWDVDDNGILFHEDDDMRVSKGLEPKDFKQSSFMGNLISLIAGETDRYVGNPEVDDGGEELGELDLTDVLSYFESQGFDDPRDPNIWEGLRFEFRGVRYTMRNGDSYGRTVPVRLLGTPDGSSKASESGPVAYAFSDLYGVSAETEGKLNTALNKAKTQTQFVKSAIALGKEVKENEDLMKALVADDGPWAATN